MPAGEYVAIQTTSLYPFGTYHALLRATHPNTNRVGVCTFVKENLENSGKIDKAAQGPPRFLALWGTGRVKMLAYTYEEQ